MSLQQPVGPPGDHERARQLLDAGLLVDLGGRPLRRQPCPCGGVTLGETCPQSLPCPTCQAPRGRRCARPSGHVLSHAFAGGWHAARRRAAAAADDARERAGDLTVPARWA